MEVLETNPVAVGWFVPTRLQSARTNIWLFATPASPHALR